MTGLRVGDRVRIRGGGEIAATLDENGTTDGLPFMPEMLRFCGGTAVVHRSAHKTCDAGAMRKLVRTVHLRDLHCDGRSHGGCQLGCLLFWNEAWLAPVGEPAPPPPPGEHANTEVLAERSRRLHDREPTEGHYSCQATEIPVIGTELPWWSPGQYVDDLRTGNVGLSAFLLAMPGILFNGFQELTRRLLPPWLRIRRGLPFPFVRGILRRTPTRRLDLVPGEQVRIRSREEITQTLDHSGLNRGLSFDWDMLPSCGRRATVSRRVETMLDERTGQARKLANPCVVLEGIACQGRYHRFCPRGQDSLWREIWLDREE